MSSKAVFYIGAVIICVVGVKLCSKKTTISKPSKEDDLVVNPVVPAVSKEIVGIYHQKQQNGYNPSLHKNTELPPSNKEQVQSPTNGSDQSSIKDASKSPSRIGESRTFSMNEKFTEFYMKQNIEDRLQKAKRIESGNEVDTALATQSAFMVKAKGRDVMVLSSFNTNLSDGCISIRDEVPLSGSIANPTLELYKLSEKHAYAAILRKSALVVIYADVEKWGKGRTDEEPRLMLYYRKNSDGKWQYQGKGVDNYPVNSSPSQTHEEFCNLSLGVES